MVYEGCSSGKLMYSEGISRIREGFQKEACPPPAASQSPKPRPTPPERPHRDTPVINGISHGSSLWVPQLALILALENPSKMGLPRPSA